MSPPRARTGLHRHNLASGRSYRRSASRRRAIVTGLLWIATRGEDMWSVVARQRFFGRRGASQHRVSRPLRDSITKRILSLGPEDSEVSPDRSAGPTDKIQLN